MAIGTQFSSLFQDLRAEVRRSTTVSVGVDDLPYLKRVINHVYRGLVVDYEWRHLRYVPPRIAMQAGQALYDFPTHLDFDDVWSATCWQGSTNTEIKRGIEPTDYGTIDPQADARQDPVLKYDLRFSGTAVQFEVWPLPATTDEVEVEFIGTYKLPRLVNDDDQMMIDDELVLLFAAAEVLKADKADDSDSKLQLAQDYLRRLKVRQKANSRRYQIGLGQGSPSYPLTSGVQINVTPRA